MPCAAGFAVQRFALGCRDWQISLIIVCREAMGNDWVVGASFLMGCIVCASWPTVINNYLRAIVFSGNCFGPSSFVFTFQHVLGYAIYFRRIFPSYRVESMGVLWHEVFGTGIGNTN